MRAKSELSHQRLLEILDYNPETGHFVWKVSLSFRSQVGRRAGAVMRIGYRTIGIGNVGYYEHRLAWFYVHGVWPDRHIDHENHVLTDNRISNLRDTSISLNVAHKLRPRKDNKSGVTGVHFDKKNGMWEVTIASTKHAGMFLKKEDAISHRKKIEAEEYGNFRPKG